MVWKPSSLESLAPPSVPAEPYEVYACEQLYRFEIVREMVALGCLISPNRPDTVDYRLRKGAGAFWKLADQLCCRELPVADRIAAFCKRVLPVILYGASGLAFNKTVLHKLIVWENTYLRRLCFVERHREE